MAPASEDEPELASLRQTQNDDDADEDSSYFEERIANDAFLKELLNNDSQQSVGTQSMEPIIDYDKSGETPPASSSRSETQNAEASTDSSNHPVEDDHNQNRLEEEQVPVEGARKTNQGNWRRVRPSAKRTVVFKWNTGTPSGE